MVRREIDLHVLFELLEIINMRTIIMAVDLTNLTAQETRLIADVDNLLNVNVATQKALADLKAQIASGGTNDTTVQAALDVISANLAAEAGKVEAAANPPAAATSGPTPNAPTA